MLQPRLTVRTGVHEAAARDHHSLRIGSVMREAVSLVLAVAYIRDLGVGPTIGMAWLSSVEENMPSGRGNGGPGLKKRGGHYMAVGVALMRI